MTIDRAIEILDPEHRENYDGMDEVNEACRMGMEALERTRWIPVTERLPEPEAEVVILAERKTYSFKWKGVTTHHIVTTGMYEDGSKNTENSVYVWETDGFEYDEELDAYIIPEGWWEWKHYIGDECHNYAIDDVVTHWMPLPEPPKEEQKQ